jgi:hypothetical protein
MDNKRLAVENRAGFIEEENSRGVCRGPNRFVAPWDKEPLVIPTDR